MSDLSTEADLREAQAPRELERRLGAWDGCLITVGAVIGTGIFLTGGDVARAVSAPGAFLAVWVAGGLFTLAGALTYAELGALFPHAGGLYHFLKEAYGRLAGFLYGWTALLVIMSGGIAAIAAGFADYLSVFLPRGFGDPLLLLPLGGRVLAIRGQELAAVAAILALTTVNHFGLGPGVKLQRVLILTELLALAAFVLLGLVVSPDAPALPVAPQSPPLPVAETSHSGLTLGGFTVAMVAVLWTYDGWYGLIFSAGEMRRPRTDLPLGLIGGTAIVAALYVLVNATYLRALSPELLASTPRVGEATAVALFGAEGGRLLALVILIAILGCLATTILYSSRTYLPMARDGVFFPAAAFVHPRYRTPTFGLWAQSQWAIVLVLTGTYQQLYTFVTFAVLLFHVATGAAVFVLRKKRPTLERPYRVWGYPVTPWLFIAAFLLLLVSTLIERPLEAAAGLGVVALGLPAYAWWRRRLPPGQP
jgi:APA family basic amino acid/polyamine antiporter